jgi:hypothetical protein
MTTPLENSHPARVHRGANVQPGDVDHAAPARQGANLIIVVINHHHDEEQERRDETITQVVVTNDIDRLHPLRHGKGNNKIHFKSFAYWTSPAAYLQWRLDDDLYVRVGPCPTIQ